jgi:hypothetical protein
VFYDMSEHFLNDNTKRNGSSNTPLIGKALKWERKFLDRCKSDPVAKRSWDRLEKAGLGDACKRLLWEFGEGNVSFAEVQRGAALLVHNLEAFDRALRTAKKRMNDPRAQLFQQRREAATKDLANTPWPFHNPLIRTFAEANRFYSPLNLFNLRKVRDLVGRSELDYMLALLRAGASAHGVELSGNELAALAYCARKRDIEGSAVRRLLRGSWVEIAEPYFAAVFESYVTSAR